MKIGDVSIGEGRHIRTRTYTQITVSTSGLFENKAHNNC